MPRWVFLFLVASFVSPSLADETGAARRFEQAKASEPELIAFLKKMPKGGDLHNHVTGALYSDYLLDNAVKRSLFFDKSTAGFTSTASPSTVPASTLLRNDSLLYQYLNQVSMRGWTPNTIDGHDHFFDTFDTIGTGMDGLTTTDFLVEVARRNIAQNVQYLELMTRCAPGDAIAAVKAVPIQIDDFSKALAAIKSKLNDLARSVTPYMDARDIDLRRKLGLATPPGGTSGPLSIRYIYSFSRLSPNDQFFLDAACAMTCAKADRRVVAINIVAPEDHPNARLNFNTQMKILDFLWKALGKPNVTLHAGELVLKYSPYEPMRDRIRRSIIQGHAKRIGHGVSIAWEDDLGGLFALMKRLGVAIEICLSSNDSILGVKGRQHPILLYRRAGIPVFLNTDDEGVSRSNLTNEWVRCVRTYNFSYHEMKDMARNSISYSFLPGECLFEGRGYGRLRRGFEGCGSPTWKPSAPAASRLKRSEKMQVQVRLEQAFYRFEHSFDR